MENQRLQLEDAEKEVFISILQTQLQTAENQLSEFVHGMKTYKKYLRLVRQQRDIVSKARRSLEEAKAGYISVQDL